MGTLFCFPIFTGHGVMNRCRYAAEVPQQCRKCAAEVPHDVKHRVSPACISRVFRACVNRTRKVHGGDYERDL